MSEASQPSSNAHPGGTSSSAGDAKPPPGGAAVSLSLVLRDVVKGLDQLGGSLPDDTLCAQCGKLLGHHPAVLRRLGARGLTAGPVLCCHCPEEPALRRRAARLPHDGPDALPRTFENFNEREGAEEALRAARAFAAGETAYHVLTLVGSSGSGKSHLLEAIGREVLAAGQTVRYALVADLLEELRATFADPSGESTREVFWRYQACHLLLLDDLGAEKATEWAVAELTRLVDQRYRSDGRLRLAVATNETAEELGKTHGPRLASRLFDTSTGQAAVVVMTCGDYRRQGGPAQVEG